MPIRTRTPSLFRPRKPIDRSVLAENRALIEAIDRRGVLRGALSLGALTTLTGCDVSENDSVQKALRAVSSWNDRVQEAIFRPDHLAPTLRPRRWSSRRVSTRITTSRTSSRSTARPGRCSWPAASPTSGGGPRSRFTNCWSRSSSSATSASKAGITSGNGPARTCEAFSIASAPISTARYVYFICADDYTESIDMACALHPQTMLATEYAREIIADPFGYPLRLRTSTSSATRTPSGSKRFEVRNDFRETFWSKQGFNWFAGI